MNKRPDIEMTRMTIADLDRVQEIEEMSYSTPWSGKAFRSEITENSYAHYFVCRIDNQIIGYLGMWIILEEAHITNIAVHPQHRRQGIGCAMLEFAFDKAKVLGATKMTLEVRTSNETAQQLYRKLGFTGRGIRKGYYTDTNEDAIIMWKDDLGPSTPIEKQLKWMI